MACNERNWCQSFDYHKNDAKCDLSDALASDDDVGGLKTDYTNNPYDHYSKDRTWPTFQYVPNAAINGRNMVRLADVTPAQCAMACNAESWCQSFDYHKNTAKCDLSEALASDDDVGGLKTDYPDNPYDHYSRVRQDVTGPTFQYVPSAAISGHNDLGQLANVTPAQCALACNETDGCQSFDYHKNDAKCDLSSALASDDDVGGLKTDYTNNPYDHYQRLD